MGCKRAATCCGNDKCEKGIEGAENATNCPADCLIGTILECQFSYNYTLGQCINGEQTLTWILFQNSCGGGVPTQLPSERIKCISSSTFDLKTLNPSYGTIQNGLLVTRPSATIAEIAEKNYGISSTSLPNELTSITPTELAAMPPAQIQQIQQQLKALSQKGGSMMIIVILIVFLILAGSAGGFLFFKMNKKKKQAKKKHRKSKGKKVHGRYR